MASIADRLGISGDHELIIGDSFSKTAKASPTFHSIRYDFKPASVDSSKTASVEVGQNRSVTVTVPHLEGSQQTVYRGSSQPHHKECVLIVDHHTGEVRLEKLFDNIQVKKTRSEGRPRMPAMPRPLTPIDPVSRRTSPSRPTQQQQQPLRTSPAHTSPPQPPAAPTQQQRHSPAPGRRPRQVVSAPPRRPSPSPQPPQPPPAPPAPGSMPMLGVFDDPAPAPAPQSQPETEPAAPAAARTRKPSGELDVGVLSDSDSDSASSWESDMEVDAAPPPPPAAPQPAVRPVPRARKPGGQNGEDPSMPSTNLFIDLQLSDDSD